MSKKLDQITFKMVNKHKKRKEKAPEPEEVQEQETPATED